MDFYLPRAAAYHIKIALGSFLVVIFFNLIKGAPVFNRDFLPVFLMIFFQFEIYIGLGLRFFEIGPTSSTGEYLRKTLIRLALFYLIVMVISALILVLFAFVQSEIQGWTIGDFFSVIFKREYKGFMMGMLGGIMFGNIVFFYFQWLDALKREQKLKEEKLIFRFETLKNQVRPHFLFNSLNTLSSLVGDNPTAEKFILKLSAIYRYIVDYLDKDTVELEKEIAFVKDYFYLQQIRDGDKIQLEIDPVGEHGFRILPISLQLLLENALKHNSATREKPLHITISFAGDHIEVRNNLQPKTVMERSSGLGLKNLGERFRLASGREITVLKTENEFMVHVPLIRESYGRSDH